ncbi:hypothetical protein E4U03_01595 [Rothia nasimurium]|uniref:Uncharacterized protein n=1 Tax=Rothia nasimurium TaxID=85336 RepID=A0A4Y9F5Z2_9MICC|nr:hypothetical protein [Rothia nasimurium]MBF0807312.1 hypothetical protein [Rothia nasimurium]TFU23827.1 hypothetical protein E4U03_01595 [Rothia nasimurium]
MNEQDKNQEVSVFRKSLEDYRNGVKPEESQDPAASVSQSLPSGVGQVPATGQLTLADHLIWFVTRIFIPWAVSFAGLVVLAMRFSASIGSSFLVPFFEKVTQYQFFAFVLYAVVLIFFRWVQVRDGKGPGRWSI